MWSMLLNTGFFLLVSLLTFPSPLERLQGSQFVNVFEQSRAAHGWLDSAAQSEDLMVMAQRIIGPADAQLLFQRAAKRQGVPGIMPVTNAEFLEELERELAGSVGAATAHAMVGQIVGGSAVSVDDLMAVADESAQLMEYSARLEAQSAELTRTAEQLRRANDKLTQLSVQKDGFLSQISHELRTPMTSIRAFSEILRDTDDMDGAAKAKYADIIYSETLRLTRLLDDLLDLSVLEDGRVTLNRTERSLEAVLDTAVSAARGAMQGVLRITRRRADEDIALDTDTDRLAQVFINLISNAQKYCDNETPELKITARVQGGDVIVDFVDNGTGIAPDMRDVVFEKFARVGETKAGGAGLGLAICREIMHRLGGDVIYLPGQGGAAFRARFPATLGAKTQAA